MTEIAKIGQYAENVYFGKPCGLMDQMASAVGNLVAIDFADPENPVITPVDFDFSNCGYALCIIDSKASHADLTDEYAAVSKDMKRVAGFFGKTALRNIPEEMFYREISALRLEFGDRGACRVHGGGFGGTVQAFVRNDIYIYIYWMLSVREWLPCWARGSVVCFLSAWKAA